MYNHNKAQQSKYRVHISWDILLQSLVWQCTMQRHRANLIRWYVSTDVIKIGLLKAWQVAVIWIQDRIVLYYMDIHRLVTCLYDKVCLFHSKLPGGVYIALTRANA